MFNTMIDRIFEGYTFSKTAERVRAFRREHPSVDLVSLSIGDVSCPIVRPVLDAMHEAVEDLGKMETFSGYGNYYGIDSLREAIAKNEYAPFGFTKEEIYVGDGTKSDSVNLLELFSPDAKILIGDPMYPIYRNGAYALSREVYTTPLDDRYVPVIPEEHYDVVYLCSPSNPTGNAYTKEELKPWIDYALKEKAVILFDNVYHCFMREEAPASVYEIEGSRNCVIELRSFSKIASFTGLRCSYLVLPKQIDTKRWKERTINRFNGASYVAQKGAEAVYLPKSQALIKENIARYRENTRFLKESFEALGYEVNGGVDAPYLWIRVPEGMDSLGLFELFLNECHVVVVPGLVFGKGGDDHFRVSGLGTIDRSREAMRRISEYHEKVR